MAMQSIRPERTASISARRSASERSGGFIFMFVSSVRTASSVSSRWCGVASQVTWQPAAFARSSASSVSRADTCCTWIRPSS